MNREEFGYTPSDLRDTTNATEEAYRMLLSDGRILLNLCHGNQEFADDVRDRVVADLADPNKTLNTDEFINKKGYRIAIYRRKLVDVFRERRRTPITTGRLYHNGMYEVPKSDGEGIDTVSTEAAKELSAYVRRLVREMNDKREALRITPKAIQQIKRIIRGKIKGESTEDIARELGVDPSRISQIVTSFRKLFPEHENFWLAIKAGDSSIKTKKEKQRRIVEEAIDRIQRVIDDLSHRTHLDTQEKAMLIFAQAVINGDSEKSIHEKLADQGLVVHVQTLHRLRREIEILAGGHAINWSQMTYMIRNKKKV